MTFLLIITAKIINIILILVIYFVGFLIIGFIINNRNKQEICSPSKKERAEYLVKVYQEKIFNRKVFLKVRTFLQSHDEREVLLSLCILSQRSYHSKVVKILEKMCLHASKDVSLYSLKRLLLVIETHPQYYMSIYRLLQSASEDICNLIHIYLSKIISHNGMVESDLFQRLCMIQEEIYTHSFATEQQMVQFISEVIIKPISRKAEPLFLIDLPEPNWAKICKELFSVQDEKMVLGEIASALTDVIDSKEKHERAMEEIRRRIRSIDKDQEPIRTGARFEQKPKQRHRLLVNPKELGLSARIKTALIQQDMGITQRLRRFKKKEIPDITIKIQKPIFSQDEAKKQKRKKKVTAKKEAITTTEQETMEGKRTSGMTMAGFFDFEKDRLLHFQHQLQNVRVLPKKGFEPWLGEDVANPGPIERIVSKSKNVMFFIQRSIGLRFVLLAYTIDNIISAVANYVESIFQAWKTYRTIQKRLQIKTPEQQIEHIYRDLHAARLYLSRNLRLIARDSDVTKNNIEHFSATFALSLLLETRGHLDQMKRDLAFVNLAETQKTLQKNLWDFCKSWIPNPLDFIRPLKDIVIVFIWMQYSRREIRTMYVDFFVAYNNLLAALCLKEQISEEVHQKYIWQLFDYEEKMWQTDKQGYFPQDSMSISSCIAEARQKTQRLLQALTKPQKFMYPAHWTPIELFWEIKTMGRIHPGVVLQFEKWLVYIVENLEKNQNITLSSVEKQQRLHEKISIKKRQYLYKNLYEPFLL